MEIRIILINKPNLIASTFNQSHQIYEIFNYLWYIFKYYLFHARYIAEGAGTIRESYHIVIYFTNKIEISSIF
jgi:hypothetical protein